MAIDPVTTFADDGPTVVVGVAPPGHRGAAGIGHLYECCHSPAGCVVRVHVVLVEGRRNDGLVRCGDGLLFCSL